MADRIEERLDYEESSTGEFTDGDLTAAIDVWWKEIKESLAREVERVGGQGIDADVSEAGENKYQVSNGDAGLDLNIELDAAAQNVRFTYSSPSGRATAPEGGMLTLRTRSGGSIQAFYSDQALSQEELLETLLRPVLFPALPSDEAA